MLIAREQKSLHLPLLLAMICTGLVVLLATSFGKETVKIVTDIMYIPITGIFVLASAMMTSRFGRVGSHAKAWLFYLGAAITWFLAETSWTIYELVYKQNPFPSIADVFYIIGYPLFFGFLIYYLKPVRKAISRKMILAAIIISAGVVIPTIYISGTYDPTVSMLENIVSAAYPIEDSIILVPALIGISLFFRGEVSFTWSLVSIGIIFFTIGDLGFQYTTSNNTYYTGHPVDIVLMWAYIMFAFGAIDHLRIFKKENLVPNRTQKYSDSGV